jgi:hypothetical protein
MAVSEKREQEVGKIGSLGKGDFRETLFPKLPAFQTSCFSLRMPEPKDFLLHL